MLHRTAILGAALAFVLFGEWSWGQSGAPAATAGTVPLESTYWKLMEIGGMAAVGASNTNEANLVLNAEGKKLTGSTGCNPILGSYKLRGGSLSFKPAGMTKMACPDALMKQEEAFIEILKETNKYRIEGETLELRDKKDVLAKFQARPQQRP
jgi:heat shock protein HslJ